MTGTGEGVQSTGPGRREQLLTAAREVLAARGYERTTVSSIAGRAQVAQGTFYLYFPSKEALPGALAEQLATALGEATERAAQSSDALEAVVDALVEETWRAAADFRDVLIIANRGFELATWDEFVQLTAPWREPLERLLRRFQSSGAVSSSLDPEMTAFVLRDVLDRTAKACVVFGQDAYREASAALVRAALRA